MAPPALEATRKKSPSDSSAEDPIEQDDPSAPPDRSLAQKQTFCHRRTGRQATSAIAHTTEPPALDDPLLSFAPVPHTKPRRNSITAKLQRKFIAHLAATGIVTEAARHIGKSCEAIYKLRQRPGAEGFRAAWDAALDRGVARLESGALARAIQGEERMVVSAGKVLGTEVRHNHALTMFFLRTRLPQRYGSGELIPGHPDYEALKARLREEWEDEKTAERHSPENQAANIKFFEDLRERWRDQWEREREAKERYGHMFSDPGT